MNKFIKEQLNNCRVAKIPQFDDSTTHLIITRKNDASDVLELNKYYLIEILKDNITKDLINEIQNRSAYTIMSTHLKCMPNRFEEGWTRFDGTGYDISTGTDLKDIYLGLWLPRNCYKIVKELK